MQCREILAWNRRCYNKADIGSKYCSKHKPLYQSEIKSMEPKYKKMFEDVELVPQIQDTKPKQFKIKNSGKSNFHGSYMQNLEHVSLSFIKKFDEICT